jgi:hypothetical protein
MTAPVGIRTFAGSVTTVRRRPVMYVVVVHDIKDPEIAFARGERLVKNEGAPAGVRVQQFYPAIDGSAVTCLWEADSVESIQTYVDTTLGDAADNRCYEVNAEAAFADRPLGLAPSPRAVV